MTRCPEILITGATGTMGMATLREWASRRGDCRVTVLARPSKANRRKLAPYAGPGFRVEWGDLCDYDAVARAMASADYVLHLGGMVTPLTEYHPEQAFRVNITAARNVARAASAIFREREIRVINMGSVAQLGDRRPPIHWAREGDPVCPALYDAYSLSKILAEREIAEGCSAPWISLRQTGILSPEMLLKGTDPITFHVPLAGVLEWTTVEDSARLLINICVSDPDPSFWGHFYSIGGGESYRLINYEFESRLLAALRCPPPEKIFDPYWFALRNFHGVWWADSDRLEELVPYRSAMSCDDYFHHLAKGTPWWMRLTPLVPPYFIKKMMWRVARKPHSPLRAIFDDDRRQIEAMFGHHRKWLCIPLWDEELEILRKAAGDAPHPRVPDAGALLPHGYDEDKPAGRLDIGDMRDKAAFEGGECLSTEMTPGDLYTPLKWRCKEGHVFEASPALVLRGGHWCPYCLTAASGMSTPLLSAHPEYVKYPKM